MIDWLEIAMIFGKLCIEAHKSQILGKQSLLFVQTSFILQDFQNKGEIESKDTIGSEIDNKSGLCVWQRLANSDLSV